MKRPQLLICDDETGIRESLKLILEENYDLVYAGNGQEALEQTKQLQPDLLIMDIKMPFLNGLDALIPIRAQNPTLKILIVTGYESSDVAAQAIQRGANDYLTKPFTREEVWEKVAQLLGEQPQTS